MKFPGYHCCLLLFLLNLFEIRLIVAIRKYTRQDLLKLREEVRELFDHAYTGYLKYAYPYDELRPLTCDGVDTWGSYSLTLIDALDTLAVMGNYSEFRRVVNLVTANANFDANINVSVFETNIRIVGGLLSAHLLSQRAGIDVEPGWPCNGPLLRLAEDVAKRLLAAFHTDTGMPYGTVNLRYGVPPGETTVTCTAGVGTFILEFATLSRLTGDPVYEEVAMNALTAMYNHRSSIGLFGNHIDVKTGKWVARDSGIGAGVDSYFEYMVKGALLLGRPELMAMFNDVRRPIDKYLRKSHWYVWASMSKGQVTLPVFQSLDAYWPGVLALIGDVEAALRTMHNYNSVWKQYGFTPEFYNIAQGQAGTNRESYPLRPELAESAMYVYRATSDPFMLDIGLNILRSIQHSARTTCGYATIKDSRDHTLENRMESFFLAETTKYLYLLFDPDNFIHNTGSHGRLHTLPSGKQCILDSGAYVFNTEAHPFDAAALECCHDWSHKSFSGPDYGFKGDNLLKTKTIKRNVEEAEPVDEQADVLEPKDEPEDTYTEIRDDLLSLKDSLNKLVDTIVKMNHSQLVEDWDKTKSPKSVGLENKSKEIAGNSIQSEQSEPTFQHSHHEEDVENGSDWTDSSASFTPAPSPAVERADEPVSSDEDEVEHVQPQIGHSQVMTLPDYVKGLVATPSSNPKFDPQELLQLVRTSAKARPLNATWSTQHELLTCRAQPFLIRITIAGEFLEEK